MKTIALTLTLAAAVAIAGLGAAYAMGHSAGRAATVAGGRTGLGRIIVDGRGRTLYLFEKDTRRHSACSGACAAEWLPLLTHGKPMASRGARRSLLGVIRRAGGAMQVTYAGHPLYRFVDDMRPGRTNGEGLIDFGGGWDALSPAGKKIERDG